MVIVASCILLAAWIGVLAVTLPRFYHTGSWRGAWVGFDVALLAAFAATGWAAWRRRQLLIISLVVLATLLLCDAWFDVVLDVRTAGFFASLLSALLVELPLAMLAILHGQAAAEADLRPDHAIRGPEPAGAAAVADSAARSDRGHAADPPDRGTSAAQGLLARRGRPPGRSPAASEVPVRDEQPPG